MDSPPPPHVPQTTSSSVTVTTSDTTCVPLLSVSNPSTESTSSLPGTDISHPPSTRETSFRSHNRPDTTKERQMKQPQVKFTGSSRASSSSSQSTRRLTSGSTSSHLSPPSKFQRAVSKNSRSQSSSRVDRSSSETRKQSAFRRRLNFPDLPPKTTSTITSASCVTTSAMSSSSTVLPTKMFYSRSQTVPTQAFSSEHSFKQPKREVFEYEEDKISHADTAATTTATASANITDSPSAIDICEEGTSSHQGEEGSPTYVASDKSMFTDMDESASSHNFEPDDQIHYSPTHHSQYSIDLYSSPSPTSSPRVSLSSPIASVESPSQIVVSAPATTGRPLTSSIPAIPSMFRPPPVTSQREGHEITKRKEVATACAAKETVTKDSSLHSGKGTRRAQVWQHFEAIGDGRQAKCKLCGREVSRGRVLGHLTNSGMNQHLRTHHKPVVLREESGVSAPASTTRGTTTSSVTVTTSRNHKGHGDHASSGAAAISVSQHPMKSTQPTMEQFGVHSSRMSRQQVRKITRLIGQLIAVGGVPLNMVEGDPFKQLMEAVVPHYKVPSRTTFSRSVIPSLYRSCVVVLKEELVKAAGQSVHFTTDLWSAPSGQHAFLSLTAHWWLPNVSPPVISAKSSGSKTSDSVTGAVAKGYRSFLLHAEVMDHQHTSQNIRHVLSNMVAQWLGEQAGTKAQMGFVVTDAAANMLKALRDGGFVGIRCSAHVLHLVVKFALDHDTGRLATLFECCRKIAGHFHHSVKDSHLLRQEQKNFGLAEHRLKQDVSTRWNSTFDMLERIFEQQKAIHAMAYKHSIGIDRPLGRDDWAMIEQVVAVLTPFRAVTENLSQENASLAQVIPLFTHLSNLLDNFLTNREVLPGGNLHDDVAALVRRLKEQLTRRVKECIDSSPHYMLATLCDPRVKGKIALRTNTLTSWRDKLIQRVRDRQKKMSPVEEDEEMTESDSETLSPKSSSTAACPRPTTAATFWADTLGTLVGDIRDPPMKESNAADTVKLYLSQPPLPPSTDPLTFWDEKRYLWPVLSVVAQELLSCPPTSVHSERVFSITGNTLSPHRAQLSPHLLEQMTFLKINLPKLDYPDLSFDSD